MKSKIIKKLVFGSFLVILIMPIVVSAQLDLSAVNAQAQLPSGTIGGIMKNVMLWILGIVGFVGIIGFAIAGIWYLTAAGDETRMEKGKSAMMWSIIGVMVALMGAVVVKAIDTMLSGTNSNF